MDITVAILAFNEEASIGALLDRVCAARTDPHRVVEVLVYDDGSTDSTAAIATSAAARDARVRLVHGERRQGTMIGMDALARNAAGEVIVRMDADIEPEAASIVLLADAIVRGASVAVGANEPVLERRTVASLSAAFAARVVERLKASRYPERYAVGRLVAYKTAALRRLTFPAHIINEDRYSSGGIVRGGGTVVFEPAARCRFRVPLTFADYQNQSRRIHDGIRQLARIGIASAPLPVVLGAVAASARRWPLDALCWALSYSAARLSRAPEFSQPWPIAQTTKGTVA